MAIRMNKIVKILPKRSAISKKLEYTSEKADVIFKKMAQLPKKSARRKK